MSSPAPGSVSRRAWLRRIGAGAAALGLGSLLERSTLLAQTGVPAPAAAPAAGPFTLPPLGYAYGALEPLIDAKTMELHHSKHHQAYIDNANKALAKEPVLAALGAEELLRGMDRVPGALRTLVRNHVGGHANHSLFWKILTPGGAKAPAGALAAAIDAQFGSVEQLRLDVTDAAMKTFGSGWAWLTLKDGRLLVHSSPNQDSPLMEGRTPLLGLDVWEHAYYLKYQNRRAEYLAAVWKALNWDVIAANHGAATI